MRWKRCWRTRRPMPCPSSSTPSRPTQPLRHAVVPGTARAAGEPGGAARRGRGRGRSLRRAALLVHGGRADPRAGREAAVGQSGDLPVQPVQDAGAGAARRLDGGAGRSHPPLRHRQADHRSVHLADRAADRRGVPERRPLSGHGGTRPARVRRPYAGHGRHAAGRTRRPHLANPPEGGMFIWAEAQDDLAPGALFQPAWNSACCSCPARPSMRPIPRPAPCGCRMPRPTWTRSAKACAGWPPRTTALGAGK